MGWISGMSAMASLTITGWNLAGQCSTLRYNAIHYTFVQLIKVHLYCSVLFSLASWGHFLDSCKTREHAFWQPAAMARVITGHWPESALATGHWPESASLASILTGQSQPACGGGWSDWKGSHFSNQPSTLGYIHTKTWWRALQWRAVHCMAVQHMSVQHSTSTSAV